MPLSVRNSSFPLLHTATMLSFWPSPFCCKQNVHSINAKSYRETPPYDSSKNLIRGDSIFYSLPRSKTEVKRIKRILQNNEFIVQTFTGTKGTEESFLHLNGNGPQILHLTTHGFYYTLKKAVEIDFLKDHTDTMLQTGLIMSRGNSA